VCTEIQIVCHPEKYPRSASGIAVEEDTMLRRVVITTVLFWLIGCSLLSHAQKALPDTPSCPYSFTSGTNNTYLNYCVSVNGNIFQLTIPQSHQSIFGAEGYGLCNESPVASYWDWATSGNSGNWNSPILLNQTAKSVKIARTTADGTWTLTQTITQDAATPSIKVVMALKNNTAVPHVVYLVRFADLDPDGNDNDFSATTNSAFAWNPSIPFGLNNGYGVELRNVGNSQFGYVQGFARTIPFGPNPCNFAGDSSTVLLNIDGSVALGYVDTIGPNKTKTATMIYRGL
jgi:hypothetical protein